MKILEANTHKEFASDQISHTADINVGYDAKSIFEPTALADGLSLLGWRRERNACAKVRHGSSTQTI
jgi:hypothetical protein